MNTTVPTQKSQLLHWLIPVCGLIIGLAAVFILWQLVRPHSFGGTLMQSPQPAQNFKLVGPGGQPVSLSDFNGKIVMLFFGYTTCPDVCPTTLTQLGKALKQLDTRASQVQVLMVSVDPERDTPERLERAVKVFDPSMIGLTGDLDVITDLASRYGVFFAKNETPGAAGYLVDHTAAVMLIDRDGYLRVVYPYGTTADTFASDIRYLLSH